MEFRLTKEQRKIVNATSKETETSILRCVHIKKGYVEASDGYILTRLKIDYDGNEEILIDAEDLLQGQDSKSKDIYYTVEGNTIHAIDNHNNKFTLARKDGDFPDTNISPTQEPILQIKLDKDLLTRLLKSLPGESLTFSFYSPSSPAKVEADSGYGLIAPMILQ